MGKARIIAGLLGILILLWWLYPSRPLGFLRSPDPVVEIAVMAPAGLMSPSSPFGGMMDAIREFEEQSRRAHARDPSRPIYRIVAGQYAARDMTADPTRFLLSVAGGIAPDVVFFDRFALPEWSSRGAFTALDSYVQKDAKAGRTDAPTPGRFFKAAWDEATYKGKVYGIPTTIDSRALIYNKDLFRRAGLTHPPRDWDELRSYARRLTQYDGQGRLKVVGFAPLFGNSWLYMYGFMAGGRFMSAGGTQCRLNEPKIVEALTYMKAIYDDLGGYPKLAAFQAGFQGSELDPFIQGKLAMKIDVTEGMIRAEQFSRDLDYGVAPPPLPRNRIAPGRTTTSWTGGFAYAIPIDARQKEAAWELIRFMTGDRAMTLIAEAQKESMEAQGRLFLPHQVPMIRLNERFARQYVYDNPRVPGNAKAGYRVFNELLPIAHFRPVSPVGMLLWQEQINAMDHAFYGRLTPGEALDQAAVIVQRDLNERLYPIAGVPINWTWFFVVYAFIFVATAAVVIRRDTMARTIPPRQWAAGLVAAGPWLFGFVLFTGGAMLFSLLISFCSYDVLSAPRFTGLYNYLWMITQDCLLPLALWNTVYMVVGVPLAIAVSLAMALLLNQKIRGIAVWRTFFYLPSIVPLVAASVLWIWIFNPQGGLVNLLLHAVGIQGPLWLQDPSWSKPALIVMGLWGAGASMIIWLAGLKGISEQLYEAAGLDGASAWQQFLHITLPQLSPYIFFNMVMGLIATFQIFGQAYIMTGGGPVNSTTFYVYHLFNNAFRYGHMGYASALAWVLFGIILAVTLFQIRMSRRWVYYESE
jgi:ABC-type sugar transport system permease subunit/ABC-type glycerol-3-phosphate transport system substrate-binding protein